MTDLHVTPTLIVPSSELEWTAVRSSGPGGQNVNKVSTKVELRFDFAQSRVLGVAVRVRLATLAKSKLDAEGRLLVSSDETRSQSQNLELARERLAALLRAALVVPKPRKKTKPSRGAKERRLNTKRLQSEKKAGRSGSGGRTRY
jgi:ribosome-associated protein